MREGKFLTINKKSTNFFLEKSKDVPNSVFKKASSNYQKTLSERQGEANGFLNERALELTPEREKIVSEVIEAASETIREYAGKKVHIDRSRIIFLPVGTLKEVDPNFQEHGGSTRFHLQEIVIEIDEDDSNSEIADKVFHELMHLGSLYRMRYGNENPHPGMGNYYTERAGLKILDSDGSTKFFDGLDEALTQKLSINYLQGQKGNPLYQSDFKLGEEVFGDRLKEGVLTFCRNEAGERVPVMSHAYQDEIEATMEYVQGIYEANQDRFMSVDQVWDVFFQAKFTGRLLQLARLIEKTHGKGAFRRLGEVPNS